MLQHVQPEAREKLEPLLRYAALDYAPQQSHLVYYLRTLSSSTSDTQSKPAGVADDSGDCECRKPWGSLVTHAWSGFLDKFNIDCLTEDEGESEEEIPDSDEEHAEGGKNSDEEQSQSEYESAVEDNDETKNCTLKTPGMTDAETAVATTSTTAVIGSGDAEVYTIDTTGDNIAITGEYFSTPPAINNCPADSASDVGDNMPVNVSEAPKVLSKKQLKKEQARQRHGARLVMRQQKKVILQEQNQRIQEQRAATQQPNDLSNQLLRKKNCSGLDSGAVLMLVEGKYNPLKTVLKSDISIYKTCKATAQNECFRRIDTELEDVRDIGVNDDMIPSDSENGTLSDTCQADVSRSTVLACPHRHSLLLAGCDHRLPDWLAAGALHCLLTRDVCDIVTNNYCISPPQLENNRQTSCYRTAAKVINTIIAMLKTGYNMQQNQCLPDDACLREYEHNSPERQTSHESIKSSSLVKRPRRSNKFFKRSTSIRWFIRDGERLLVDKIDLDEVIKQYSHIPRIQTIEFLTQQERKKLYLDLSFNKENCFKISEISEQLQLSLSYMCYWFQNSSSEVNKYHVISVLVTFLYYFAMCDVGKLSSPTQYSEIFCLHCAISKTDVYATQESVRSKVDKLTCDKIKWLQRKKVEQLTEQPALLQKRPKRNSAKPSVINSLTKGSSQLKDVSNEDLESGYHILSSFCCPSPDYDYDRQFVHCMSEYQSCVHYLGLLNSLLLCPYRTVTMDRLWSGTFCYNLYRTLTKYEEIASPLFLLSVILEESTLYNEILTLYTQLSDILLLKTPIELDEMSHSSALEKLIQGPPAKTKKTFMSKRALKKASQAKSAMEFDQHCVSYATGIAEL